MPKRKAKLDLPSILENVNTLLNSSFELRDILLKTCQTAVQTFNVDHSGLVLFSPDNRQGEVTAEYPSWDLLGETVQVEGIQDEEKLIKNRKPLMVMDVVNHADFGAANSMLAQNGIKSILLVPIISREKVLGSFSLDVCGRTRTFTSQEIKLCQLLAEKVTSAIENANLVSSLVKTQIRLDGLISSSLDALIFIDTEHYITVFNRQAQEMFGYSATEVIGQNIAKLYNDIEEAKNVWNRIHDEGKIEHHEVTLLHKKGTKIPALLSAVSIKDDAGRELGQAGFVHTRLVEERLYALGQATRAVNGSLKLDDVLQRIMEAAITAFPAAEKGVIHLYDGTSGKLVVKANMGYSPDVIEAATFASGQGRAGWVYQHGEPLVIENTQKNKLFKQINVAIDHPEVYEQKSTICVPLKVKGDVIGTISLDNLTSFDAFAHNDIGLLNIFAGQVAIAIENAQLFEESQRNLFIASRFHEISSKLYPTDAPNEALKLIAANVKDAMGALSVSVTALDTAGRPYEKAQNGYEVKQQEVRQGGLSTVVMATGEPCIVPDVLKATVTLNKGMLRDGVKAAICLPLKAQGRNVGVMWVTYAQPHCFSETEVKLLGLLANQAGGFVESAHLFQAHQLLLKTSKMVLSATNLDECLQTLAELMIKSLSATTFCRIAVVDDSEKMLRARAACSVVQGLKWEPGISRSYPIADSPEEERVIRTGKIQILRAEQEKARLADLEKVTGFEGGLNSAVLIPLSIGEKVFGVIALGERRDWERGSFTLERVGLYDAMAGQVAGFIIRMRLQEQAEKNFAQLRRLYDAGSKTGSSLDPDQTLHFIVEKACEAVEGWRATAILLDKSRMPRRLATFGFDKELEAASSIRSDGISMEVIQTGEPEKIEDTTAPEQRVNPAMVKDGVRAAVCLPLRLGEENIGVLWVHFKQPKRYFPFQIEALKLYATQAAIAYNNARRMRELEHMHQAAQAIAGVLELPQVLQQIVKSACEVLDASSSAIWSYDNLSDEFIPEETAAYGISSEQLERFRKREPKKGGTAQTVMARGGIEVADISDPRYGFMGNSTLKLLKSIGAKSFQGVALEVSGEKLGVLYINYNTIRAFSKEDRETLETFAYHASTALKKARLVEQLKRAQNVAKMVANLSVLGDKPVTLSSVASGTRETTGCDAVALFEFNPATKKLGHPPFMLGVRDPTEARRAGKVIPGSIVYEMLWQSKPYCAENIEEDQYFRGKRFALEEEIKSCLAVPLIVNKDRVGVMFVNYRSPHHFTPDELATIGLYANQAAVEIRRAQLQGEAQKRLESRAVLLEASKAINSSLALEQTLERITELALKIVRTGSGNREGNFSHIALLDERRLPFVAAHPPEVLPLIRERVRIDLDTSSKIGVVGRAVQNGATQHIPDVTNSPDFIPFDQDTRSQLSVPLRLEEGVIGVLSIESPEIDAFAADDVQNIELLASQAAIAIQNSRQYERLKDMQALVGPRTASEWMKMVSYEWGHAIRRDCGTALRYLVLIRQGQLATDLTQVEQDMAKLKLLIEKISETPIVAPLANEDKISSVKVNQTIDKHINIMWLSEPYSHTKLKWNLMKDLDNIGYVVASPQWILRCLEIFIDNSVNAIEDFGCPERIIEISTQVFTNELLIIVKDSGPGFPKNQPLEGIGIEPVHKLEGTLGATRGAGLGLVLAKTIAKTYGGDIRIIETGSQGTTIALALPWQNY